MNINWLKSKSIRYSVAALLVALTLTLIGESLIQTAPATMPRERPAPVLTTQGEQHLLYGDARGGGGHLHGANRPCKSEFPADWDAQEVISTVQRIAANDNLNWRQQDNGYHVAEDMVDNIRVRIVLSQDRSRIITAYPTNVTRNPCPTRQSPANDN